MMALPDPSNVDTGNEPQEWRVETGQKFPGLEEMYRIATLTGGEMWVQKHVVAFRLWKHFEDIKASSEGEFSALHEAANRGLGPFFSAITGVSDSRRERQFRLTVNEMKQLADHQDDEKRLPFGPEDDEKNAKWLYCNKIVSTAAWRVWVGKSPRPKSNISKKQAKVVKSQEAFGTPEQFAVLMEKVRAFSSPEKLFKVLDLVSTLGANEDERLRQLEQLAGNCSDESDDESDEGPKKKMKHGDLIDDEAEEASEGEEEEEEEEELG
jgi:hypothetical protein